MTLTTTMQVFLAGLAGGIILEIFHWYNIKFKEEFPQYARSIRYWVVTVAMAVAGGIIAIMYFGSRADGIVALHVGLSTPLILQKLTTTAAGKRGAMGTKADLVSFFRW